MKESKVTLERRANEQGHLFGSVSATDIARGLQAQGFNIEAADVNLPGKLDRIDTYQVQIKFADDLKTDVKVWVAPDAESKAAIDAAAKGRRVGPPAEQLRKRLTTSWPRAYSSGGRGPNAVMWTNRAEPVPPVEFRPGTRFCRFMIAARGTGSQPVF